MRNYLEIHACNSPALVSVTKEIYFPNKWTSIAINPRNFRQKWGTLELSLQVYIVGHVNWKSVVALTKWFEAIIIYWYLGSLLFVIYITKSFKNFIWDIEKPYVLTTSTNPDSMWICFPLGGTPYPGMYANEVLQSLLEGKRMEPPIHCPQEM